MNATIEATHNMNADSNLGVQVKKKPHKTLFVIVLAAVIAILCSLFAVQALSFADMPGYAWQDKAKVEVTDPDGNTTEMIGFYKALDMCKQMSGYTVKLMEDIVIDASYTITNDTNITIDLKGSTINCDYHKLFTVDTHATLKLISTTSTKGTIIRASSSNNGAAVEAWGTTTVENIRFDTCDAPTYGGAIAGCGDFNAADPNPVVTVTVTNCEFVNCFAEKGGGAIGMVHNCKSGKSGSAENMSGRAVLTVEGCSFDNCRAKSKNGGALYLQGCVATANNCIATNCLAKENGGFVALWDGANLVLENSTITGCTAVTGSAVSIWGGFEPDPESEEPQEPTRADSSIEIYDTTITDCTASETTYSAGAVHVWAAVEYPVYIKVGGDTHIVDNHDSNGNQSNICLGNNNENNTAFIFVSDAHPLTEHAIVGVGVAENIDSKTVVQGNPFSQQHEYTFHEFMEDQMTHFQADFLMSNGKAYDSEVYLYMAGDTIDIGYDTRLELIDFKMSSDRLHDTAKVTIDRDTKTITVEFEFQEGYTMEGWDVTYIPGHGGGAMTSTDREYVKGVPFHSATATGKTYTEAYDRLFLKNDYKSEVWEIVLVNKEQPKDYGTITVENGTANDKSGTQQIQKDAEVYVEANADTETSKFLYWEASGMELTEEQTYSREFKFNMPFNVIKLTAHFSNNTYTLTTINSTYKGQTESNVEAGTEVTVLPTETGDKTFRYWTGKGYTFKYPWQALIPQAHFTMPANDVEVEAVLESGYSINAVITINGNAHVSSNEADVAEAENTEIRVFDSDLACEGDKVTMKAIDDFTDSSGTKMTFDHWEVLEGSIEITAEQAKSREFTFIMQRQPVVMQAVFTEAAPAHSVKVINGTMGGKTEGSYTAGTTFNVKANTPTTGRMFSCWVASGIELTEAQAKSSSITLTMPDNDVVLTAMYTDEMYDIVVDGGSYYDSGWKTSGKMKTGSRVEVRAETPAGKKFVEWKVVKGPSGLFGSSSKLPNTYIDMPKQDIEIEAVYTDAPTTEYNVAVTHGTATISGTEITKAKKGQQVTVKADEASGTAFKCWVVQGIDLTESQRTSETLTFTMPGNDVSFTASYDGSGLMPHDISVEYGTLDHTAAKTSASLYAGTKVTATADTVSGKVFKSWEVSGVELTKEQLASNEITFTMPDNAVTLKATYEDGKIEPNTLTVDGGTLPGYSGATKQDIYQGTTVKVKADDRSASGEVFHHWEAEGIALTEAQTTASEITIEMPGNDAKLTAVFWAQPVSAYAITTTDAIAYTGDVAVDHAVEGTTITAVASSAGGKTFKHWETVGIELTEPKAPLPRLASPCPVTILA